MNFTTKVASIVSGTAIITFVGIKLRNMSRIHNGTLISEGNKNFVLNGSNFQGRYSGNCNSNINCEESEHVEVMDSRNLNANIVRSSVKASNQINCILSATASNIDMKCDKNIDVQAEDAWCKFENNVNLKYKGKGGANEFLSRFIGNRNGEFTGTANNIVAIDNRNLTIKGNNNRLEISGTRNHDIRPASIGSNRNSFTLKRSGSKSIAFLIQYVGAAIIRNLGTFHFNIVENDDKVTVILHGAEEVTYSILERTYSKIVIKAEQIGTIQMLELNGDRVDAIALNSINLFVNFA